MPIADIVRTSGVSSRLRLASIAVLCAGLLAGCCDPNFTDTLSHSAHADPVAGWRPKIPLPSQALLAAQPAPECEYKTSRSENGEGRKRKSQAEIDEAYRVKLEHERECYREAEIRVRRRLQELQTAVGKTTAAARKDRSGN